MSPSSLSACPLLMPDDWLVLHGDFRVHHHALLDMPLGARHTLHHTSSRLFAMLRAGCRYGDLLQSDGSGADEQQIRAALGTLNTMGGLHRVRTGRQRAWAAVIVLRHGLVGVRHHTLVKRSAATRTNLLRCIAHCLQPLIAASVVSGALLVGTGFFATSTVALHGAFGLLLFAASLYVHESVHIWFAQRAGIPCVLLRHGMRMGILHRRQQRRSEQQSALGGPMAGLAICLVAAASLAITRDYPAALLSITVGSFHLGSLLPWYADGAALFKPIGRAHVAGR